MSKEDILRNSFNKNVRGIYGNKLSFDMSLGKHRKGYDWVYEAMEEWHQKKVKNEKSDLESQLNKAKELLKKVLNDDSACCDISEKTIQEIESFLSENK